MVDLQTAENCARQIEYTEKQKENERKQSMINQFKQTGQKPEGWDRSCDYEHQKQVDFGAYEKRKEQAFENTNTQDTTQDALDALGKLSFNMNKYNKIVEGVSGNEDIIALIDGTLKTIETKERKHEFCNTLIKYLREKSIEYSRG